MPHFLHMREICKSYPGVQALRNVSLTLEAGEVLALMGENGAGKSTLIKILGGAVTPQSGSIEIDGKPIRIASPHDARRAGIAVIYQEFNLLPNLTARENIFLGRETTRFGFLDQSAERRSANELLRRVGANFDGSALCKRLSIAQQQAVEIAKALGQRSRIFVMDEPTAALTPQEVDKLMAIIAELKNQGIAVIYISHRLEEVLRVADRVAVLRDGANVATMNIAEVSRASLIEMMVGRKLESEFPPRSARIQESGLVVSNITRGQSVRGVSFTARSGEVVALTGLVGSGRTETVRLLFGADRADSGTIELHGKRLRIRNPKDAIDAGICLLTEDRKQHGLVLGLPVVDNFGLSNLAAFSSCGAVWQRKMRRRFATYIEQLRIQVPHDRQLARHLSGGNQQKVVLAKWLEANSQVVILDEPTRGIDVGAKYEIYRLINELVDAGKVVVIVSSELPEVLGMADRILVMHAGRLAAEIADARVATQHQILELAVG